MKVTQLLSLSPSEPVVLLFCSLSDDSAARSNMDKMEEKNVYALTFWVKIEIGRMFR